MRAFSTKNKNKRPKFLFNLQINELVNVPQSSGNCFVKWKFKDSAGVSNKRISSEVNIETSRQTNGATPRVPVKHHKAQWNYSLGKPIQIKFEVNKNDFIVPNYVDFEVYLEAVNSNANNFTNENTNNSTPPSTPRKSGLFRSPTLRTSNTSVSFSSLGSTISSERKVIMPNKSTGKIFLGHVLVNITEYINPKEEPMSNKFLLKDSKINSILSMSFQLKLIRGSYEEFKLSDKYSIGQLSSAYQPGIASFLDNSNVNDSTENVSSNFSSSQSNRIFNEDIKSSSNAPPNCRFSTSKFNTSRSSKDIPSPSNTMGPIIKTLYEKTFQLPWDERPNEFTPRECIDDILKGGNGWAKNENGINLIDLQALRLANLEENRNVKESHEYSMDSGKSMKFTDFQDDDNYWNNMNKREFLEKKHQQVWSQMYDASSAKVSRTDVNNPYSTYSQYDNPDASALVEDAKSWTIKKNLA